MNLTDEQREQLQQRLADVRYQLRLHGAEPTPMPQHAVRDHEALAFIEWEEHRVTLIAEQRITLRARRPTVDKPRKSQPESPIAPQVAPTTVDITRPTTKEHAA